MKSFMVSSFRRAEAHGVSSRCRPANSPSATSASSNAQDAGGEERVLNPPLLNASKIDLAQPAGHDVGRDRRQRDDGHAATRSPAMIVGSASGSSTRISRCIAA